jgi:nitroreductase
MKLLKEIQQRKSPNIFLDKEIEKEKIDVILEAARLSPSCFNNQPWIYVLVNKKDKTRKELEEALNLANYWAKKASYLIVVGGNPKQDSTIHGTKYYLYDLGLSVMSLVIEAEHQGLKAHQMAGWNKEKVSEAVKLPEEIKPVVVIALGIEDKNPKTFTKLTAELREKIINQRKRKPINEIAFFGEYKK